MMEEVESSLHLNSARRLASDDVYNAANSLNLIDDPPAHFFKNWLSNGYQSAAMKSQVSAALSAMT